MPNLINGYEVPQLSAADYFSWRERMERRAYPGDIVAVMEVDRDCYGNARKHGEQSFLSGKDVNSNPYRLNRYRAAWFYGWQQEKDKAALSATSSG